MPENIESVESAIVRFCGDSGDGMQLTGSQFTDTSAIYGNDINTLPDFPAEIRAPAGTVAGVSGFQINFSSKTINTPGDKPVTLVAMNAAAFKKNINDLIVGGVLIVNSNSFTANDLKKAKYDDNPLEDPVLEDKYKVYQIPMTELVLTALEDLNLKPAEKKRCKNFFALGLVYWLYERPLNQTLKWLEKKFKSKPLILEANKKALLAGHNYGDISEMISTRYQIQKYNYSPGRYRNIMGNQSLAYGLIVGAQKASLNLVFSGYPITPASDILHELSKHKNFDIKTIQAEDEIAAIGIALGASYSGAIGVTASSGPGICLKGEFMGLAASVELPLIIIDVQRGGPSTGLPTKIEQSDLYLSYYGRNGESPMPIIAAQSPSDCFQTAYEAIKIAIKYMTPVIILSDGYLGNGSELWNIPNVDNIDEIPVNFYSGEDYLPYQRDEKTLTRKWVKPGTPKLQHVLTGLEKDITGSISYDPENHQTMSEMRRDKIDNIANDYPKTEVHGKLNSDTLIISWGSSFGACRTATDQILTTGKTLAHVHIRYINPLPKDLASILKGYKNIIVAELNLGQMINILRTKFENNNYIPLNKIEGQPFTVSEITQALQPYV